MIFKKWLTVLCTSVLLLSLAGCGEKDQSKTFVANINGVDMSLTYTYKDDVVSKQTASNKIPYSSIGASTKEDAEKILGPLSAKYQNVTGVEEKIAYQESHAEETLTVDFKKANVDDLKKLLGTMSAGDTKQGISMKQSQALLEAQGFKEVK